MIQLPTVPVRPAPRAMVAAPPAARPNDQILEELRKLGELKAQGVITDDELATLKARILAD
jgi:hypothetical protein